MSSSIRKLAIKKAEREGRNPKRGPGGKPAKKRIAKNPMSQPQNNLTLELVNRMLRG